MKSVSRDAMRALDKAAVERFGIPGLLLMENAGAGAARHILAAEGGDKRALILCGKGNNGGDGFVIARHLHNAGLAVKVIVMAAEGDLQKSPDAWTHYQILRRMNIDVITGATPDMLDIASCAEQCDFVVDALLGTGARGKLDEMLRKTIVWMNQSGRTVYAVDVPSGLDCDTGLPLGVAVCAARTFTFGAPKLGFDNPESREYTGPVTVVPISLPRELLADE